MIPAMLVLDIIPEFRLYIIPLDTTPFSPSSESEKVNHDLRKFFGCSNF